MVEGGRGLGCKNVDVDIDMDVKSPLAVIVTIEQVVATAVAVM